MAYGQSKLANILHAKELARRLKVFFTFEMLNSLLEVFIDIDTHARGKRVLRLTGWPLVEWEWLFESQVCQ